MTKAIGLIFGGGHVANWQAGALGAYKAARESGRELIVFWKGFKGANSGKYFVASREQIFPQRGGIYFGSSRDRSDTERIADNLVKIKRQGYDIEGIVGFCGNDHLEQTYRLFSEKGIPVIGWPKTMDNDLSETYFCLGYHSAATEAIEAMRRGIDCASTNGRIHIVSMFGRDTDWIVAAAGGFSGAITVGGELGSNNIYVTKYRLDYIIEKAKKQFEENEKRHGIGFSVIAVAESAAIEGLESHVNMGQVDEHGHPKIEPEKLALVLKDAFKEKKLTDVSTDTLTYDNLRSRRPTEIDERLGREAGGLAVQELLAGRAGASVIVNRDLSLSTKPLPQVFKQRFLRPEGFIDYDNLRVNQSFIDYYKPIFGEPSTIAERVPMMEVKKVD